MGGIRYYEKNGHEEHSLGSFNAQGVFEPGSWFTLDAEDLEALRESLLSAYFGETELYMEKAQSEWHDGVKKFLKCPEIDSCSKNLISLYNHGEAASGLRRRYQRENGEVLNGVYETISPSGQLQWLLINAGCLKATKTIMGDANLDRYGSIQFLVIDQHSIAWKKADSSEEPMDESLAKAVVSAQIPRAEIFVGRKKDMLDWAEKAEGQGLEVEVYGHRSDGEKYRIILSSPKSAHEWLSESQLVAFLESLASDQVAIQSLKDELLSVWATLRPKTSFPENFSVAAQAFMETFWKGQPLRVCLSDALHKK